IPRRRPADRTAGSAGGVKEAPRRRRGCLDAAEQPARLKQRAGPAGSAGGGVRLWFEPIDEPLEDGLEAGIVGAGVVADDIDGFAVVVSGLAMVAAGFADHAEAVVAVMDIGEAREQVVGGLFGGIEIAGADHVDHGVGRLGQLVEFIMFMEIAGQGLPARRHRGRLDGTCGTGGGLVTGHAALLVFLAAPAGAGIIPSDFGHLANVISKDGPSVPSRADRRQVPRAVARLRPRPGGLRPRGAVLAMWRRAAFGVV